MSAAPWQRDAPMTLRRSRDRGGRGSQKEGPAMTGVAILTGDLTPKRIQLLKEAVTGMARLAILEDLTAGRIGDARLAGDWQAIEAASRQLGIHVGHMLEIHKPEELDDAFARAVRERAGGLLLLASP